MRFGYVLKPLDMVERSFYSRAMQTNTPSETRQRLLDHTERLIYHAGIGATGMDAIVKSSGIARKSIYRYFDSKEDLVSAALRARDQRWMQWFVQASSKSTDADENLLSVFDALETWFAASEFRGCAFINAAGEIGDVNAPIRTIAKQHKTSLYDHLRELTLQCEVQDANQLAAEFLILVDGAITIALVMGDKTSAGRARLMAAKLLAAAKDK